ncbi:MAG: hypothetical protein AB8C02_13115 [Halioglobus sp.]
MTPAQKRYYRTLFLGVAAMGALAWGAMDQFDLSASEMGESLFVAFLLIAALAVIGAVIAGFWVLLRTLLNRKD